MKNTSIAQESSCVQLVWGGASGQIDIIAASLQADAAVVGGASTGLGEFMGAFSLSRVLSLLYPSHQLEAKLSSDVGADDAWKSKNLVLIGGPMLNSVYRSVSDELVGREKLSFGFDQHRLAPVGNATDERPSGSYGHFWKKRNPFCPDRWVWGMAGSHTRETVAAVAVAVGSESLKRIANKRGDGEFEFVVSHSQEDDRVSVAWPPNPVEFDLSVADALRGPAARPTGHGAASRRWASTLAGATAAVSVLLLGTAGLAVVAGAYAPACVSGLGGLGMAGVSLSAGSAASD